MAWLWRDGMRWLLCPRYVRRPVLATCALALSRSRTWLCCTRCCSRLLDPRVHVVGVSQPTLCSKQLALKGAPCSAHTVGCYLA
eukprot:scaffold55156_cov63-Phaeocystis_antarctica.AAC.3